MKWEVKVDAAPERARRRPAFSAFPAGVERGLYPSVRGPAVRIASLDIREFLRLRRDESRKATPRPPKAGCTRCHRDDDQYIA